VLEREFPGVLHAAAGGDEGAFARLYRDAHPLLLRYLQVVAPDAAEDLAAEVWLETPGGWRALREARRSSAAGCSPQARRRVIDLRPYSAATRCG